MGKKREVFRWIVCYNITVKNVKPQGPVSCGFLYLENYMLKSCPYCGRIHDNSFDCGKKPKRISRRHESEEGRYTRAWRKKAALVKAECHYLCEYCLSKGRYTYEGLSVHHIVKLRERPDLLLDDNNLVCLCGRCHALADDGGIPAEDLRKLAKKRIAGLDLSVKTGVGDIPPRG